MELQQRVDKLEKERWAYLAMGTLAVVAGIIAVVLSSRGAAGGTAAGSLEWKAGQGNAIVLQDKSGKPRLSIGLNEQLDPDIKLFREGGALAAELFINDAGFPRLRFLDSSQYTRASIGLEIGGDPIIEFGDSRGTTISGDELPKALNDLRAKVAAAAKPAAVAPVRAPASVPKK